MTTLAEVERLALALPEQERVVLVNHLLDSLPPEMDAEGITEALRRDAEMQSGKAVGISAEELFARLDAAAKRRRGDDGATSRRFMRLAGSVQGASDLSEHRGFRAS